MYISNPLTRKHTYYTYAHLFWILIYFNFKILSWIWHVLEIKSTAKFTSIKCLLSNTGKIYDAIWPFSNIDVMFIKDFNKFRVLGYYFIILNKLFWLYPKIFVYQKYFSYFFRNFSVIRDHSFSTYADFSEKLTFLIPWYANLGVYIRG